MSQQYRYRTSALLGRWLSSHEEAVADAVRAGLGTMSPHGTVTWRVDLEVEGRETGHIFSLRRADNLQGLQ